MFTARIAITESEAADAYRLRYEVFFDEEGDSRYADHERRFWIDADDTPLAKLIVVMDETNRVVATGRVTALRDCRFIGVDAYRFDRLAEHLGVPLADLIPRIARLDRGVVARNFRGRGARSLLQQKVEEIALTQGCDVLVGAAALSNHAARAVNEKLGFEEYPHVGTHGGFTAQPIFKLLSRPKPSTF